MFFRQEKRSLLAVHDDYASLRDVSSDGQLLFELSFTVDAAYAISQGFSSVRVSVNDATNPVVSSIKNVDHVGYVDNENVIRNILRRSSTIRTSVDNVQAAIIASSIVDLTAYVSNDSTGEISMKRPVRADSRLSLSSITKELSVENVPLLNVDQRNDEFFIVSSSLNTRSILNKMLLVDGIDPSSVCDITDTTSLTFDTVSGMTFASKRNVKEHESLALYASLLKNVGTTKRVVDSDSLDDSEKFQVLVIDNTTLVTPKVTVTLPKLQRAINEQRLTVTFELLDSKTGVPVDTVVKSLNVIEHVQLRNMPKASPKVNVVSGYATSRLSITLVENQTGVDVYKRSISTASSDSKYVFVGTFGRDKSRSIEVDVENAISTIDTYMVVPVGIDGQRGSCFTTVVLRPDTFAFNKTTSIIASLDDLGVRLECRNFSTDVVSVEFLVKDHTAFDTEYSNVDDHVHVIDVTARDSGVITIIDGNVCDQHVYEYACRVYYVDGTTNVLGCAVIAYRKFEPGKVTTNVSDVSVEYAPDLDVKFNVTTDVIDTNVDVVRRLLRNSGTYDLYVDDVKNEREKLQALIAHNVQRIDLTTGEREDFGVVTDNRFSDVVNRSRGSVSELRPDRSYRYEITALVRNPNTMLSTTRDVVDATTKRTYTINPRKHMHPVTLRQGTLLDQSSQTLSSMMHGQIGGVKTFDVSFTTSIPYITDVDVRLIESTVASVQWTLVGDSSMVDHFIVMHESNGTRTIVGRSHAFSKLTHRFVHVLSRRHAGAISYVVVPVLSTYVIGSYGQSNVIVVDDGAFT